MKFFNIVISFFLFINFIYSKSSIDISLLQKYPPFKLKANILPYYNIPLTYGKNNPLWENIKIDIGVNIDISPAFTYTAIYGLFNPIAILDFQIKYGYIYHYNTFGYGFEQTNGNKTDMSGLVSDFKATLKYANSTIIVTHSVSFIIMNYNINTLYYDIQYNIVNGKNILLYDTFFLFKINKFLIGVNNEYIKNRYNKRNTLSVPFVFMNKNLMISFLPGIIISPVSPIFSTKISYTLK